MSNEADTCRAYVVPRLLAAGWEQSPHRIVEQKSFTDGRIIVAARPYRRAGKRADYLLCYQRDLTLAVVEAEAHHKLPADGMQQAKEYAEILDLKFAYATNGRGIVEFDYLTGRQRELDAFPSPDELWTRLRTARKLTDAATADRILSPTHHTPGKELRYYQEIAVNRTVEAILKGRRHLLLTLATGTGKTLVAFQICWKLWNARWNREGAFRRPRILYLADRNILVDDPHDKDFAPFGEARQTIENGEAVLSREMYFSTYQAIAEDERRPGLYRAFPRDFFDLIVVDECHRGSARDEGTWREILTYFSAARQIGMTATPLRADNRATYRYFGDPIYQYSLRQGIDDGFLAPYRVHRVLTSYDALGWRPSTADLDRYGRTIPDAEYHTKDFERAVALRVRTETIAKHLTEFLKKTDRFAKTIVFCVDQEHALEMCQALTNLNSDLVQKHPDYACRVTADEGEIGRGHLGRFQDVERRTPVILTTSQLLTTGVDVPTCKNIVIARVINSMIQFKQIIGRGTRVRDDYGKFYFDIIDYTGSATQLFADPEFDGDPAFIGEEWIDDEGHSSERPVQATDVRETEAPAIPGLAVDEMDFAPRKYYFDGGWVDVLVHVVYELDPDGGVLRMVKLVDYTAAKIRSWYPSGNDLRAQWSDPAKRLEIIGTLRERGIDLEELAAAVGQPDADPFDLLSHVAFSAPLRTRRERAEHLRRDKPDFFDRYGVEARAVLLELLEKYAGHGVDELTIPDSLEVPPISARGNLVEIARLFGGPEVLGAAVRQLQTLLYAA